MSPEVLAAALADSRAGGAGHGAPDDASAHRGFGPWKWLALGVGVAAGGAGALALVHADTLRSPAVFPSQESAHRRTFEHWDDAGIALTAAGGAALVTAACLFVVDAFAHRATNDDADAGDAAAAETSP